MNAPLPIEFSSYVRVRDRTTKHLLNEYKSVTTWTNPMLVVRQFIWTNKIVEDKNRT